MKIVIINLDDRPERLDWMQGQLTSRGLEFERFPALTPDTMPADIRARFRSEVLGELLAGEIGCFASHLRVAHALLESGEDCWLVLEDDFEIEASADELEALYEASADQTLVKLSDWPKTPALELKRVGRRRLVRYWAAPRGTGAYFLTRRGAEALLACAHDLDTVADDFFRRYAHSRLSITGVVPPPGIQDRFSKSTVDPGQLRAKMSRRRRPSVRDRLAEAAAALRLFGLADATRLGVAFLAMRMRRVKRDTASRYVLSQSSPRSSFEVIRRQR